MPEKRILLVHPYDKTTAFLDRIKRHLVAKFASDVDYFNVEPNDKSHRECLDRIESHTAKGFIVFLGHGRSDKLYGAKGDDHSATVSSEAIFESPDRFYYNNNFINEGNIIVFKGKKVFCLACNSNEKIGRSAIEHGAVSFIGFGDIPTSTGEFEESGAKVNENMVAQLKGELNYIVKVGLTHGIDNNFTVLDLLNIVRFITSQRISHILNNTKRGKDRNLLVDSLYYFKKEVMIFGEGRVKLLQ